jgi:hypothetical protein
MRYNHDVKLRLYSLLAHKTKNDSGTRQWVDGTDREVLQAYLL